MKKALFSTLILVISLASCSGLLWDARDEGDLTLAISNPFSRSGGSASNRALAAEGKYIYIELALISDQTAFDNDQAKSTTGNGKWINTGWGGHAVLTLSLTDLASLPEEISATLKGVPRDKDLKARVFLDGSEVLVTAGVRGSYDPAGSLPICQTYNVDETVFGKIQWVTVSSEDLKSNQIVLTIRPYSPGNLIWGPNKYFTEIAAEPTNIPLPGELMKTNFVNVEPDLTAFQHEIQDAGYFVANWGFVPTESSPPAITGFLYDESGLPASHKTVSISPGGPTPPEYRYFQMQVENLPDTVSPLIILGLTRVFEPYSDWSMSYGLLYDSSAFMSTDLVWSLPNGVKDTDLDFRAIQFASYSLGSTELQSINQINALEKAHDSGWVDGTGSSYTSAELVSYDGRYIVILAKPAGASDSQQFIFAKIQNGV